MFLSLSRRAAARASVCELTESCMPFTGGTGDWSGDGAADTAGCCDPWGVATGVAKFEAGFERGSQGASPPAEASPLGCLCRRLRLASLSSRF